MSRVAAASGANYSAHNEKARKFEPIAPVGTNYSPIGRPDINAMRKPPPKPANSTNSSVALPGMRQGAKPPKTSVASNNSYSGPPQSSSKNNVALPGMSSTFSRERFQPTAAEGFKNSGPDDAWPDDDESQATKAVSSFSPLPPVAAASRPLGLAANRSIPSAASQAGPSPSSNVLTKPAEEDRIAPVGTSGYKPVVLAPPKKLNNRFAQFEQQPEQTPAPSLARSTGKLTWSEKQALAKKQAEDDEARSKAASASAMLPTVPTVVKAGVRDTTWVRHNQDDEHASVILFFLFAS